MPATGVPSANGAGCSPRRGGADHTPPSQPASSASRGWPRLASAMSSRTSAPGGGGGLLLVLTALRQFPFQNFVSSRQTANVAVRPTSRARDVPLLFGAAEAMEAEASLVLAEMGACPCQSCRRGPT